jgi:hypothetical protein
MGTQRGTQLGEKVTAQKKSGSRTSQIHIDLTNRSGAIAPTRHSSSETPRASELMFSVEGPMPNASDKLHSACH